MAAYISEVKYSTEESDYIEVGVTTGTDLSGYSVHIYRSNGTVENVPLSLGSVQSTNAGKDAYVANPGEETLGSGDAIALVDDNGTVIQFISFNGNTITATEGPASGETSTDIGASTGSNTLQSGDGGASYAPAEQNRGFIPCYAPGTLIDTPDGPRAVETLRPGDLVVTLDHGPQLIRWMRSGEHPLEDVRTEDIPVLIQAGSLGAGRPTQDLIISPQHRILVGGHQQLQGLIETEAFAPAKSLTGLPGVRHMKGKTKITWIHFACDRHELVFANGCLSESLLLGLMVVNGLTSAERRALANIFGSPESPGAALNGPSARQCLRTRAVRRRLAEYSTEMGQSIAKEIRKWDRDLATEQYEPEPLRQTI